MTSARCDRAWLAEAYREGRLGQKEAESFDRHCRTCTLCVQDRARDERLRALARGVRLVEPGELALRRLRWRILGELTNGAPSPPSSWRRSALASSIGIGLLILTALVAARAASRTRITAPATATSDSISHTPHTPRARADAETMVPLTPVIATNVAGVDRDAEALRSLDSASSRMAEPRPVAPVARERAATVVAGQLDPTNTQRGVGAGRDLAALGGDEGAQLYVDAMRSFREERYGPAAAAFHAFALAFPLAGEVEDASFLEAVSLAKDGRPDLAALAAERHLERFPRSFRRKEASILVARAATRRGQCDQARGVLAPWMGASADAEIDSLLVACAASR